MALTRSAGRCARIALPMPEAWKELRVPGRKKARIAWCVST
jgi:hypothetical protein